MSAAKITVREALGLIGATRPVELVFLEECGEHRKDWRIYFRAAGDVLPTLVYSTICKTHNLLDLPVDEIRPVGSCRIHYADRETTEPSKTEIFVSIPESEQVE